MSRPENPRRGVVRGLDSFRWAQRLMNKLRWFMYVRVWGMDISPTSVISLSARLDRTNPTGVHIASNSYIAFEAVVLTHDMCRALKADTYIGDNCFIGGRAIVLPGIRIGNGSIVAAGAVVTRDVPEGCIVAGNPARVIRAGIHVGPFGVLKRMVHPEQPPKVETVGSCRE